VVYRYAGYVMYITTDIIRDETLVPDIIFLHEWISISS